MLAPVSVRRPPAPVVKRPTARRIADHAPGHGQPGRASRGGHRRRRACRRRNGRGRLRSGCRRRRLRRSSSAGHARHAPDGAAAPDDVRRRPSTGDCSSRSCPTRRRHRGWPRPRLASGSTSEIDGPHGRTLASERSPRRAACCDSPWSRGTGRRCLAEPTAHRRQSWLRSRNRPRLRRRSLPAGSRRPRRRAQPSRPRSFCAGAAIGGRLAAPQQEHQRAEHGDRREDQRHGQQTPPTRRRRRRGRRRSRGAGGGGGAVTGSAAPGGTVRSATNAVASDTAPNSPVSSRRKTCSTGGASNGLPSRAGGSGRSKSAGLDLDRPCRSASRRRSPPGRAGQPAVPARCRRQPRAFVGQGSPLDTPDGAVSRRVDLPEAGQDRRAVWHQQHQRRSHVPCTAPC